MALERSKVHWGLRTAYFGMGPRPCSDGMNDILIRGVRGFSALEFSTAFVKDDTHYEEWMGYVISE